MYRGTTPTLYFKMNGIEDLTTISDVDITIKSKDVTIDKKIADVTIDVTNKIISLELTQEETLSFSSNGIKLQLKVLLASGKVCASPIFTLPIEAVLNTDIMVPPNEEEAISSI